MLNSMESNSEPSTHSELPHPVGQRWNLDLLVFGGEKMKWQANSKRKETIRLDIYRRR
jgi:hypothetical protein